MTTSLRVYFVRHGATDWTISGQYTGGTDVPLSASGEVEARQLAPRLRGISFSRVLTSPLQRARRTCELAGLGASAEIEPELTEWNNGEYEGRTLADILGSQADWNLFRDGGGLGGETPREVCDRVDRFISRLMALEGNVALFSHGHFGRVLGARWIGLSVAQGQGLLLDPASLSILGFEHGRRDQPAIVQWNSPSSETPGGRF